MSQNLFTDVLPTLETGSYRFDGANVISMKGPPKLVATVLKAWFLSGYVTSSDQILKFGVNAQGDVAHLVVLETTNVALDQAEASVMSLDGFSYMHLISAMKYGINVALMDEGFVANTATGRAIGNFARVLFKHGRARGSDSNTLLLLGTSTKNRVLIACQCGYKNPFRVVPQVIEGEVRFTVCQNHTLIAAEYGTSRVVALHAEHFQYMIKTGDQPAWKSFDVCKTQIEELSLSVPAHPTLVVTATIEGQRVLIPGNVYWFDGTARFGLALARRWATLLPADKAPVVRVSASANTVAVVNPTGSMRLAVIPTQDFNGDEFVRLAKDAVDGTIHSMAA